MKSEKLIKRSLVRTSGLKIKRGEEEEFTKHCLFSDNVTCSGEGHTLSSETKVINSPVVKYIGFNE